MLDSQQKPLTSIGDAAAAAVPVSGINNNKATIIPASAMKAQKDMKKATTTSTISATTDRQSASTSAAATHATPTKTTTESVVEVKAVKSKSTKNKCAFKEHSKVSYQRETEAFTTGSKSKLGIDQIQNRAVVLIELESYQELESKKIKKGEIDHTTNVITDKNKGWIRQCHQHRTKLKPEHNKKTTNQKSKGKRIVSIKINSGSSSIQKLAEHKDKLRSDFLRCKVKGIDKWPRKEVFTEEQSIRFPRPKVVSKVEHRSLNDLSLIAQRKAELLCRIQLRKDQSSIVVGTEPEKGGLSPTTRVLKVIAEGFTFPHVFRLIQQFDNPTNRIKNNETMIVKPKRLNEKSENNKTCDNDIDNILTNQSNFPTEAMRQRQLNDQLTDEDCHFRPSPCSFDSEVNEILRTEERLCAGGEIPLFLNREKTCTNAVKKCREKVTRSSSSDSALGLEVDEANVMDLGTPSTTIVPTNNTELQQRRMTLTVLDFPLRPGLLPLAEPTALLDSPTAISTEIISGGVIGSANVQQNVPSKLLLEERVIGIPETLPIEPRTSINLVGGGCGSSGGATGDGISSRRESAQSSFSDYPNSECGAVRYVRTPSVVVSDYSDDTMCGITLEEIEYFRAQRMRACRRGSLDTAPYVGRGTENGGAAGSVDICGGINSGSERDIDVHSDVSASSSCSNLYYCGSTISALDGGECYINGIRVSLERKSSGCSGCSISGEDDDSNDGPIRGDIDGIGYRNTNVAEQQLALLMAASNLSGDGGLEVEYATGSTKKVGKRTTVASSKLIQSE